ncbi:HPr family phosphocarrier protein [Collinsella sp. AGMB00827]|uniref:HPr family phosphocarrier protein n=1 Tax=Collinsella ureilytica TaxID=2869515 RepID=A0ABS7MJM3_9ACTN|nr:HPr family phosphocarrier protein [Collinsella urealyticum]MBY4797518.1 HPr family phosphocarrier protein [Collinsella urealyticum]
MIQFSHIICDPLGLHARPVAQIAAAAMSWDSKITVSRVDSSFAGDRSADIPAGSSGVDAKDLMALMSLNAACGDELIITVQGSDEQAAAQALRQAFTF